MTVHLSLKTLFQKHPFSLGEKYLKRPQGKNTFQKNLHHFRSWATKFQLMNSFMQFARGSPWQWCFTGFFWGVPCYHLSGRIHEWISCYICIIIFFQISSQTHLTQRTPGHGFTERQVGKYISKMFHNCYHDHFVFILYFGQVKFTA